MFGFVSNSQGGVPLELALGPMLSGGRALRGIVQGGSDPHRFIPMLIDLYLQGRFPFDRLIRLYDFADINEAIVDSEAGRAIKPVLHISEA